MSPPPSCSYGRRVQTTTRLAYRSSVATAAVAPSLVAAIDPAPSTDRIVSQIDESSAIGEAPETDVTAGADVVEFSDRWLMIANRAVLFAGLGSAAMLAGLMWWAS
ncbi:hypothetical protein BH10ACT3_BH10ACT3_10900 [soil metagenome]